MINQKAIQTRFATKSNQYTQFAQAQYKAAETLLKLLKDNKTPTGLWLDLGSGPGILSKLKNTPTAITNAVHLDISLDSLRIATNKNNPAAVQADMDLLPLKPHSFDGIISSSALQWSQQLEQTLKAITATVKPNGYLALSVMGKKTLNQLKLLQEKYQIKPLTHFYDTEECHKIFSALNLNIKKCTTELYHIQYPNSKVALRSISQIGAATHKKALLTPGKVRELYTTYDSFFDKGAVTHSYEYHFYILQKGDSIE